MSITVAVTVLLAVGVGLSLGLLGGGGSILAVPLLVYVAGLPPTQAIAGSLLVVGVASAVGVLAHARAGRVQWRIGLLFGAAGMAGAYGGGRLAAIVPATVLLVGFAIVMIATAVAMIRGRRAADDRPGPRPLSLARAVPYGAAVGLIAGLVGAGGGFLVVPALVLLGGLAMPAAVGTSLIVIAMQSLAGFAGHLSSTTLPWGLVAAVTAATVAGGILGARLAGRVRPDRLRRLFGWLVLAMAALILGQQLPALLPAIHPLWTALILVVVMGIALMLTRGWPRPGGWSGRSGARYRLDTAARSRPAPSRAAGACRSRRCSALPSRRRR